MTVQNNKPAAIRVVIPFVFRHWLNQPVVSATVISGFLGATVADLFMPMFSGHLVDALTSGAADPAARGAAWSAFAAIVALGLASMILRLTGLQAIVPFTLRIMSDVARDAFMRVQRTWLRYNYTSTAQLTVLLCLRASVIGGSLLLWIAGRATPGDVTYVLTSYYIIHAYLRDVGMHINNLQRSVNDMEELVAIHDEPIGIADASDAKPIDIEGGRIVFEDVTFHYGGHRAPLYDGLSLDIRAGERVGLVGRSGSGKTTFVKLVQRLYDVSGGRILIDGQDIARATQYSLRSQIAIVQQDPILFHRTLAENIAYGRPGASTAAIEQAARLANAQEFILRLPKGYGTLVGERGVKLSGGERQRVALARAFLADAPVLILDEATSSLDSESEALIQQAMERLMKGRTSIVIAHRLSTVRSLDRILVFDRGRIVEQGSHAALAGRAGGIYRGLFERQVLEFERTAAAE